MKRTTYCWLIWICCGHQHGKHSNLWSFLQGGIPTQDYFTKHNHVFVFSFFFLFFSGLESELKAFLFCANFFGRSISLSILLFRIFWKTKTTSILLLLQTFSITLSKSKNPLNVPSRKRSVDVTRREAPVSIMGSDGGCDHQRWQTKIWHRNPHYLPAWLKYDIYI